MQDLHEKSSVLLHGARDDRSRPVHRLGRGNPADGRQATESDPGTEEDLSLGVRVVWLTAFAHNAKALVLIRPGDKG